MTGPRSDSMPFARLVRQVQRRAIILRLGLALAVITLIGVIGMAASVNIVEKVKGSAGAINVSGSLRMQSHRMGNLALAGMMEAAPDRTRLREAMTRFEARLEHPSLRAAKLRDPKSAYTQLYDKVQADWKQALKPTLVAFTDPQAERPAEAHWAMLAQIDAFVTDIDRLVAVLERDTEEKIGQLHTLLGMALAIALVVVTGVLYFMRRQVFAPMTQLANAAGQIARGDFSARAHHLGPDELGRVGQAFNLMADDLSKLYRELEQRVNEQTEQLTLSNRYLMLLYHSIARLYHDPVAPDTYRAMLEDLEQVLGLRYSMACLLPEQDGLPRILATTLDSCPGRGLCENVVCADCANHGTSWVHSLDDGTRVQAFPLRDAKRQFGMLQVTLPPGRDLEEWENQLIDALTQHIGIAIGLARQAERERRLALMDERSVIARELHDSIAQSLSYMKIQASLLQQAMEGRRADADNILKDLREGINAAYRQLRELLTTFRLRMEGDFPTILNRTIEDYARRGSLDIQMELHLGDSHLSPNQEIHVLLILREALNNVVRHAEARHAWVNLKTDAGHRVSLTIDDDGRGIPMHPGDVDHYGLTIMRERARSLRGDLMVAPRPHRGTRVSLHFNADDGVEVSPFEEIPS